MTAKRARTIRRTTRKHSQNIDGLGVSELFLASEEVAREILAVRDIRLKCYLLGFTRIPPRSDDGGTRGERTTSAVGCDQPTRRSA